MRQDIEDFRLERKIPYLLHFTRAENLPSVMTNGLVSRASVDSGQFLCQTNDDMRLDGRPEFNCLSITFPNSPMFYKFKSDNPDVEWPILVINPLVLSRFESLFCWQNAASKEISTTSAVELTKIAHFKGLFQERSGFPTRTEQFLKSCDPTHVQAEVLVRGTIPPKAIYSVIFPSIPCWKEYTVAIGDRQPVVSDRRGYYGTRQYYRQWGIGK